MKRLFIILSFLLILTACATMPQSYYAGLESYNNRDYKTAERHFADCLAQSSDFSTRGACATDLGSSYWMQGKRSDAIRLWQYAARNDNDTAKSNLITYANQLPPPVDPNILYQQQRALEAVGEAAYSIGGYAGGGDPYSSGYRGMSIGVQNRDGTQDNFNLRTGEKEIQMRNQDGSYDTFRFGR